MSDKQEVDLVVLPERIMVRCGMLEIRHEDGFPISTRLFLNGQPLEGVRWATLRLDHKEAARGPPALAGGGIAAPPNNRLLPSAVLD